MQNGQIIYRDISSPLGEMIAGATAKGICFLEWHDRGGVDKIKNLVAKRYKADLQQGNNELLDLLESEIQEYFNGELKKFSVPIDVSGTTFEMATWRQLLKIPYGETRSYSEIATMLEKPEASRAVGRANGANNLSIVIPCHRVIDAGGSLRGYGGKLWRKKRLLELEQGLASSNLLKI